MKKYDENVHQIIVSNVVTSNLAPLSNKIFAGALMVMDVPHMYGTGMEGFTHYGLLPDGDFKP